MPVYTLVVTTAEGHQHSTLSDFPSDEVAIGDAGRLISAEDPSVAIARDVGDVMEFLGAWDWGDGSAAWNRD